MPAKHIKVITLGGQLYYAKALNNPFLTQCFA